MRLKRVWRSHFSWVYKGDEDVADAMGGAKALVEVSQPPRMYEGPTGAGAHHRAVVTHESSATALHREKRAGMA